jgi:hypothetical protein
MMNNLLNNGDVPVNPVAWLPTAVSNAPKTEPA